ncbi:cell division protein FtsX [Aureimonas mangrovi]|uniref:cell division protein FtsX n=1 Tax=Aureimonas mangrovi TaxID=2758041 RepID=UPI00163D3E5B|nr:ABC transporter permease [Aureimonas mangrovi]
MTELAARLRARLPARLAAILERRAERRRLTPIVPPGNVAGRALMTVIAIMTFLAALTLGAVILVSDTASDWESEISREITVQVEPEEGFDMAGALALLRDRLSGMPGVVSVDVLGDDATSRLLEPWLGAGTDLSELPVPRLLILGIDEEAPPDFAALRADIENAVPQASLDDHRAWISRLVSMARATVVAGVAILSLVLVATILTVVFATRGAMSGNRQIIEVLHFVGARSGFIAGEFQRHFLRLGLAGSLAGGAAALLVFAGVGWWASANSATPQADQITALFGSFAVGWTGYLSIFALVLAIGLVTALTSRLTVMRQLAAIDMLSPVER